MQCGHIKIHRALTGWGWYTDLPTCKLWLHILLRANYRAVEWKGIEIPRGAFATSYAALAAESGLSVQQVRTAIGKLKKTGEITVETNRHYTIITACKYDEYQCGERDEVPTPANCPPKSETPKKAEKPKPKEPDLAERFSEPVLSAVRDWLAYKQERRQGYKPTGRRAVLSEIENRVKRHGEAAVAEVIRLSMANNWQGIIWDRIKDAPKQAEAKPEETPDWELAWRAQKEEVRRRMREEGLRP